jgi:hypothetical protein
MMLAGAPLLPFGERLPARSQISDTCSQYESNSPPQSPQLVEILFGAYRRQILALLLLRPNESFYARRLWAIP